MYCIIFVMFIIIIYEIKEERYRFKKQLKEIKQIKTLNEKINEKYEKIQELWRSSLLQQNLNKQIVIYSEKKIGLLEDKYSKIVNSYKILFFRKMANLILEDIITQYKDKLSKTENIFLNKEKPNEKQKKFSIIVVSKEVNNIKGFDKNLINLIFDFLNYIKDISSSIIHISEKNYLFQIEILSEYIGREITKDKENDKYYINSFELINILFDKAELPQNDYNKMNFEKSNELLKEFNDEEKLKKKVDGKDKEIKIESYNEEKKTLQDNIANNDKSGNIKEKQENEDNIINHYINKSGDEEKKREFKDKNEKEIQIFEEKEEKENHQNKENCDKNKRIQIDNKIMEGNINNINEKENKDNNEKKIEENKYVDKKGKIENGILKVDNQEENLENTSNKKEEDNIEKGDSIVNNKGNKKNEEKEENNKITKRKNKKKKKIINKNKKSEKSGIDEERKNGTLIESAKICENKKGNNINSKNPKNNNIKEMEKYIEIKFEEILERLKKDKKENDESLKNSTKNINSKYFYDFKELEKILFGDLNEKNGVENWKIEFTEDLKKYVNLITKLNSNGDQEMIVFDIQYIFKEWKKSFEKGYKQKKEFQNLVKLRNDIDLPKMKEAILILTGNHKYEIFVNDDPSNFQKMIDKTISKKEIMNY